MAQINKPNLHFNTITYTGNADESSGTTQSITGVGFQPDMVWIKSRSAASGHTVWDNVRGTTKWLTPNGNNIEQTYAGGLTSFDSDGFSMGDGGDINRNGNTQVAWNWLAAGTAPSKTYAVTVVSDGGNKYRFDGYGTSAVTLEISEGGTYRFDQSDSSNSGHPLRFSTTSDGTHGGGSEYTTGVTTVGTPGSAGAYTEITVAASAPTLYYYCSVHSGMGGQANTPTTNSFSSFDGSIQSNISPNTTAGFSIVKYTGDGSASATVGHGLNGTLGAIWQKDLTATDSWHVMIRNMSSGYNLYFNNNGQAQNPADGSVVLGDSTTFGFTANGGNVNAVNESGIPCIAYCFKETSGFSKFGVYKSNAGSDNAYVYTGFKPAWVMIKRFNSADSWIIFDNKRNNSVGNPFNEILLPNLTDAEKTDNLNSIDICSNGFKVRPASGASASGDGTGDSFMYMAFADKPLVGSNNVVSTAN